MARGNPHVGGHFKDSLEADALLAHEASGFAPARLGAVTDAAYGLHIPLSEASLIAVYVHPTLVVGDGEGGHGVVVVIVICILD